MSGGAIAAIVIVLLLVLVGAGVGIYFAVNQSSGSSGSDTGYVPSAGSGTSGSGTTGGTAGSGREYLFYPNLDSNGNDITNVSPYRYSSLRDLLQKCDSTPGCVAVNTNGWIKNRVNSSLNTESSFMGANDGIYVLKGQPTSASKTGVPINSATASDATSTVVSGYPKRTYNFYQGKDMPGNDIIPPSPYQYVNISDLLQKCNATTGCVAVNTNGWIKNRLNSALSAESSFAGANQGVYVLASSASSIGTPTSTVTERFRGARNLERFVNW